MPQIRGNVSRAPFPANVQQAAAGRHGGEVSTQLPRHASAGSPSRIGADRRGQQQLQAKLEREQAEAFCNAAAEGDMDALIRLHKAGADPNKKNEDGDTPLIVAVDKENTDMVKLLLGLKDRSGKPVVDVDVPDTKGWTALHYAAWIGHGEIARILLDRGADPNKRNESKETPLVVAAYGGKTEVVDLLLGLKDKSGKPVVDVRAGDGDGLTALGGAAHGGYTEIAQALLDRGADPNTRDVRGGAPLVIAASQGKTEVVKLLLGLKDEDGKPVVDVDAQDRNGGSALGWAARGGYTEIVRALLDRGADPNQRAGRNSTPLMAAVREGKTEVVKLLLGLKDRNGKPVVDIDVRDQNGWTALGSAAYGGHTEIVRALLERGADPNQRTGADSTPLILAANQGKAEVVNLLLDLKDRNGKFVVDVNAQDQDGWGALSWAIRNGNEEIVRALLDRGADPDLRSKIGGTPLILAAYNGKAELVHLLLGQKDENGNPAVEVDARGDDGWSALACGAASGCVEIVQALLDRGADPNTRNETGGTPLMTAASLGKEEVVNLLLGLKDENGEPVVDLGAQDQQVGTALHIAAQGGHPETVRILLAHGADPTARNDAGGLPLMAAANHGKGEVVKLLLELKDEGGDPVVDVDEKDREGWTALAWAAYGGHADTVQILLDEGADPNEKNKAGGLPLMAAASQGKDEVITLLLELKDEGGDPVVDVDEKDREGWTALAWAAYGGHADTVQILLDEGADPNEKNKAGGFPLIAAASQGKDEVVKLLLGLEDEDGNLVVDIDEKDQNGWTALTGAAAGGHTETVRALLDEGADPNARNKAGGHPLMAAALQRKGEVVSLLLGLKDENGDPVVDVDAQDYAGRTALHGAAEEGHTDVVQILLDHGADPNKENEREGTPLMVAANKGKDEVVKLLLGLEDEDGDPVVDIDEKDRSGWTALHCAAYGGYAKTVRILLNHDADPATRNERGGTPLTAAAGQNNLEVVKLLLDLEDENGDPLVDIDEQEQEGWTALHYAASEGHREIVQVLLDHEADPNMKSDTDSTPLMVAAAGGNGEVVKLLLDLEDENGDPLVDIGEKDEKGWTALHCAAQGGDKGAVQNLLDHGADLDAKCKGGGTVLMVAAKYGKNEVIKLLLGLKDGDGNPVVDVDEKDQHGWTALGCAIYGESTETIQILLDHGSDPNIRNVSGITPLAAAATEGKEEVVKLLLDLEDEDGDPVVDADAQDQDGWSALHCAVDGGYEEIVQALLEYADANTKTDKGETPLILAAKRGEAKILDLLLEDEDARRGMNTKDAEGFTALHYAGQNGDVGIVDTLLNHPHGARDHNVYSSAPLHAILPVLKKGEDECGRIVEGFHRHLVAHKIAELRLEKASAPASVLKREIDRLEQEMQQAWKELPFDARKMRILESWLAFHATEPQIDPAHTAMRKAQERMRMLNMRLSSRTNLYLGTLLAQAEQKNKAVQSAVADECAKDARFRLTLALEQALQGYESLSHVQECAQQLLHIAPQEQAFTIGGVTWLASEVEELAAAAEGELTKQIELAHNMAEGREAHAHQGGHLLMNQGLLEEMQRRNAERKPVERTGIAQETLADLSSLQADEPFSQVFHTGIYWEYEAALRMHLSALRDYLAAPSEDKLEALAGKLLDEIRKEPLEDVIAHYHRSPDPNGIEVLPDELNKRREMPEVKRIVRGIQMELMLRPEIETRIAERIFEDEDEAWNKMPLRKQDKALIRALIGRKICADEQEARQLLKKMTQHEAQLGKLVEEMVAQTVSLMYDEIRDALPPTRKDLLREMVEGGIFRDRAAVLEAFEDGFEDEQIEAMIDLGLFQSHEEFDQFQASPEFNTLSGALHEESRMRNQSRQELLAPDNQDLVGRLIEGRRLRIIHEHDEAFESFEASEKLLADLVAGKVFATRAEARDALREKDSAKKNIDKLIEHGIVNGPDEAQDALDRLARSERLVGGLVQEGYFSSRDAAREALAKPEGKKHARKLANEKIGALQQKTRQDLSTLIKTESELLARLGGFFSDRDHARRYLEEVREQNWYWERGGLQDFDTWLRKNERHETLRDVALAGLHHTFSKSRPVQDKVLRTDTHTAVQTVWDYIVNQTDERSRGRLEKSLLHKLLDIGQDPMCNTVSAQKVISTPLYIDMTLRGRKPSLQTVEERYEELLPALPDLEDAFDDVLMAPPADGKKNGGAEESSLLAPEVLRARAALNESSVRNLLRAEQSLKDWTRENRYPLDGIKARFLKIRAGLREINGATSDAQGGQHMDRLRKLNADLQALDKELKAQYKDYVPLGRISLSADLRRSMEAVLDQTRLLQDQLSRKEKGWRSAYQKALEQQRKKVEDARARLEEEPGTRAARESVARAQTDLRKASLMEYMRRRGWDTEKIAPLVDEVVRAESPALS